MFNLQIELDALDDIQQAVNYYNSKKAGLGTKYYNTLQKYFTQIKKNPNTIGTRYDDVHCLPIKKFPFMIHYQINTSKKIIVVFGVVNTYRDPQLWFDRTNK